MPARINHFVCNLHHILCNKAKINYIKNVFLKVRNFVKILTVGNKESNYVEYPKIHEGDVLIDFFITSDV